MGCALPEGLELEGIAKGQSLMGVDPVGLVEVVAFERQAPLVQRTPARGTGQVCS